MKLKIIISHQNKEMFIFKKTNKFAIKFKILKGQYTSFGFVQPNNIYNNIILIILSVFYLQNMVKEQLLVLTFI
jgi:hypothetical protein